MKAHLGVDGKYLAIWIKESGTEQESQAPGRLRIWEVDSGQELSAPDRLIPSTRGDLGNTIPIPDATGVRWIENTRVPGVLGFGLPIEQQDPFFSLSKWREMLSSDYLVYRWDRKSGLLTSHRFRPGNGKAVLLPSGISADGRIVVFGDSMSDPSQKPSHLHEPMECWNIADEPPHRLWSVPDKDRNSGYQKAYVSPNGKMVAICTTSITTNSTTLYRTEQRQFEPIAEWQTEGGGRNERSPAGVSDQGQVLFTGANILTVIDRESVRGDQSGWVGTSPGFERKTFYHRDSLVPARFTSDGRKLITILPSPLLVRVRNTVTETDPDLVDTATSLRIDSSWDGRLRLLEQTSFPVIGNNGPQDKIFKLKDMKSGAVLGQLNSPERSQIEMRLVAGQHRVFMTYRDQQKLSAEWVLYDTDGLRRIAGGQFNPPSVPSGGLLRGFIHTSQGGRWLIEGLGERKFILRDALTGTTTTRIELPEESAVIGYAFDANEDQIAIVSGLQAPIVKGLNDRSEGLVKPSVSQLVPEFFQFDVRLYDARTGAILWNRPGIDRCHVSERRTNSTDRNRLRIRFQVLFSPTGNRLLIRYQGTAVEGRVWIGQVTNGTTERIILTPPMAELGPDQTNQWMSVTQDGRCIAIPCGRDVQMWDLESGGLISTLRGHDGNVTATEFSPDGTRLFCLEDSLFRKATLTVWDRASNRVLLTIQSPEANRRRHTYLFANIPELRYRDGKIHVERFVPELSYDGNQVKD